MKNILFFLSLMTSVVYLQAQVKWNNPSDAIQWINEKIAKISQNDLIITQSFETDASNNYYTKVAMSSVNASGKSSSERYEFYLEHLNPQSFVVNVSGKSLTIKLTTQNQSKVIKYYKGDVFSSFVNSMEVYFDDIQQARQGIEAMQLICEKSPASQVSFASKEQAYNWLKNNIKESREGVVIQNHVDVFPAQSHKMVLTAKETDTKGSLKESKYEFYIADFTQNSFQIKAKGTRLELAFTTSGKLKPVKYFQDGVQKNYTNRFSMYGTDPLNMMQILNAFKYLAGGQNINSNINKTYTMPNNVESKSYVDKGKNDKNAPIVIEVMTKYGSIEEALTATKMILLRNKFVTEGNVGRTAFTSKRTTGSRADYYIADVSTTLINNQVKVEINFVKIGTGLLNLRGIAEKVKAELES